MPFVAELAIVADTTLSIVLKLIAPVAPTPIAVALPLMATATAMPKASESIREVLVGETVIGVVGVERRVHDAGARACW